MQRQIVTTLDHVLDPINQSPIIQVTFGEYGARYPSSWNGYQLGKQYNQDGSEKADMLPVPLVGFYHGDRKLFDLCPDLYQRFGDVWFVEFFEHFTTGQIMFLFKDDYHRLSIFDMNQTRQFTSECESIEFINKIRWASDFENDLLLVDGWEWGPFDVFGIISIRDWIHQGDKYTPLTWVFRPEDEFIDYHKHIKLSQDFTGVLTGTATWKQIYQAHRHI